MTKRQRELHELVRSQVREIAKAADEELRDRPWGFSACIRLVERQFVPYGDSYVPPTPQTAIIVTKTENGYVYREYSARFFRKGRTEPRSRLLPAPR